MNDEIFQEIANQIKSLHNGALSHIKNKEFAEAATEYRKALIITEKLQFYEGMAITLFGMANLSVIIGDLFEAMNNAADAKDMFVKAGKTNKDINKLVHIISELLKKKGISLEREAKFQEAIECYEASIPFAGEKSKKAMTHEVNLLKQVIQNSNQIIS